MRSHTKYLTMNVPARMDFVNITDEVTAAVAESGVREGLCLVNAMHITASSAFQDLNDSGFDKIHVGFSIFPLRNCANGV
jgi:thiamine phosphate synthase YjbQ (UPF0047 family)